LGSVAINFCKNGIKDSKVFLQYALQTIENMKISHIAISIECKRPRVQSKIDHMRKNIFIPFIVLIFFLVSMFWRGQVGEQETNLISPISEPAPIATPFPETSSYIKDFRLKAIGELLSEVESPLESEAETFVNCADNNQVDPYLLVGISRIESTYGKQACDGNPFGWSSCRTHFSTLKSSCQAVASGIATLSYYKQYRATGNVEDLGEVYCPSSSGCNTEHWANTVKNTKTDLQERELILSLEELATLTPSNKSIRELKVNTLALKSHSETSSGITQEVVTILIKANEKALANAQHEL